MRSDQILKQEFIAPDLKDTRPRWGRYVGVPIIAGYLGTSPAVIYKWVSQNRIPYKKINGSLRFDILEIERWIKQQNPQRKAA
jgi:predicted DNA-binding transcriptional regulator AlpA